MTDTKEVIHQLKEVKKERNLSLQDIINLLEHNGDFLSKATLSRIFADGNESVNFRYEDTIRPLANALLNLDHSDEDVTDIKALKSIIHYKNETIKQLEKKVIDTKLKYTERLEKEHQANQRRVDFLKEQIIIKDERISKMLDAIIKKDGQYERLMDLVVDNSEKLSDTIERVSINTNLINKIINEG